MGKVINLQDAKRAMEPEEVILKRYRAHYWMGSVRCDLTIQAEDYAHAERTLKAIKDTALLCGEIHGDGGAV